MEKALVDLLRGYSALVPVNQLDFLPVDPATFQEFLITNILTNAHLTAYPPAREYQRVFWKRAIYELEESLRKATDADVELDPRVFNHYLSLLSPPAPLLGPLRADERDQFCPRGAPIADPPSACFITHYYLPAGAASRVDSVDMTGFHTVTLFESRTTIEAGTTGLRTWLASYFLAQYILTHPGKLQELVTDTRVLELGCGNGLLGIIIATLQQLHNSASEDSNSVWLTDVNTSVLARCRDNIKLPCNLSSVHPSVNYRVLDWSDAMDSSNNTLLPLLQTTIKPELILGADLVFDPRLVPSLVAMLRLALQNVQGSRSNMAFIALTIRNEETLSLFLNLASEHLAVEDLGIEQEITDFIVPMEGPSVVKIYRISIK